MHEVQFTLVLALVLVILVIFLFLRNLSATVIPAAALPMSIIGTFSVMYLLGYSVDTLSLLALTLCVGFVVDDAIVMLENIARHLEMGKTPLQATLDGSREIAFTILSMTLSLAVVFVPVLFMGGVIGRLLHEFAVTIMAAILISGFVSLSLTPMLCGRWLRPQREQRHGRLYQASERAFDAVRDLYDRTLRATLALPRVTMASSSLTTALAIYLGVTIPKGFLPTEDVGSLFAFTEGAQDISSTPCTSSSNWRSPRSARTRTWHSTMSFIGVGGSSQQMNLGRIVITLKPRSERPSADRVMQELRPALAEIPGLKVFLQNLPSIRLGGTITKSQFQFTLQSADLDELYHWAPIIEERVRAIPGFQDVTSDLQIKNTQVDIANRPRQGGGAAAGPGADPERALQRLRLTPGVHHLHPEQRVLGDPGGRAAVPARRLRAVAALCPRWRWEPGSTRLGGAHRHLDRTAVHQSSGAAAGGHHLLQPGAGDGLGRRRQPGEGRTGGSACARHTELELPGSGPGLPVLAGRDAGAVADGGIRHLPDPGHPLRELHPPDHHPLRPAFGGAGRAADAAAVASRARHFRLGRPADARSASSRRTRS